MTKMKTCTNGKHFYADDNIIVTQMMKLVFAAV